MCSACRKKKEGGKIARERKNKKHGGGLKKRGGGREKKKKKKKICRQKREKKKRKKERNLLGLGEADVELHEVDGGDRALLADQVDRRALLLALPLDAVQQVLRSASA